MYINRTIVVIIVFFTVTAIPMQTLAIPIVFDDGTSIYFTGFDKTSKITTFAGGEDPTPLQILGKAGITVLLNILGSMLADQIGAWLGIPVKPNTSLAATDFSDNNIATAFLILAYADGGPQTKVGVSSTDVNIAKQTVKKTSSKYPGTFAEIGVQKTGNNISIGAPPNTPLEAIAKAPPPTGPYFLEDTQAVAFGFLFAKGQFFQIGAQDTDKVFVIPEPTSFAIIGVGIIVLFLLCISKNSLLHYYHKHTTTRSKLHYLL